jgi:hypothetical protein
MQHTLNASRLNRAAVLAGWRNFHVLLFLKRLRAAVDAQPP